MVDKLSSPGVRILRHVPPPPITRLSNATKYLTTFLPALRVTGAENRSRSRLIDVLAKKLPSVSRRFAASLSTNVLSRCLKKETTPRSRAASKQGIGRSADDGLLLLGATIVLGIIAWKGWNEAKSRYFAILSLSPQVQGDQDLSVLLANEAIKANRTQEAEAALRLSLFDRQARRTLLRGHTGPVYSGSFSPDGNWIVTAGRDNTALLRRASSQQPAVVLNHDLSVRSANFSADGRRILTACEDGSVRIWDGVIERAGEVAQRGTPIQLSAQRGVDCAHASSSRIQWGIQFRWLAGRNRLLGR